VSAVRVLVVEDDPNVRGLLRTLLEAEGYAVDTASDGLGALGQAAASSPALVLLDLVMPDLGGLRVLELLRDDPVLERIPVIVVTGHEEALHGVRTLLGTDNVFFKPFAVAELLSRVAAVTGGP
jgi:DNA-binding response OmpR family regulator